MKGKSYICLITAVMLLAAGCGAEKLDISSIASTSTVENTTESSKFEESMAGNSTADTSASVNAVEDETGVYPETTGIAELGLGIENVVCTIKVPLNYILAGAQTIENGTEKSVESMGATVTVESSIKDSAVSEERALNCLVITSLDDKPTSIDVMLYDIESVGNMDTIKNEIFPDGKEIGDSSMPGWVHKVSNSALNPNADFAIVVQISEDTILDICYQGPVVDEVGEDEMAQRVYNLLTKK